MKRFIFLLVLCTPQLLFTILEDDEKSNFDCNLEEICAKNERLLEAALEAEFKKTQAISLQKRRERSPSIGSFTEKIRSRAYESEATTQTNACPYCNKRTPYDDLKMHITTKHPGRKKFVCPRSPCTMIFHRINPLHQHVRVIHDKQYPYTCPHCSKPFARLDNLQTHINKKHPDIPQQSTPRENK